MNLIATVLALALASGATLPQSAVVPLSVVRHYFPQVTRIGSTGVNSTAVGNPKATRSVIYANGDSSKKVTVTVDRYASAAAAESAFQQAVQKSKIPGFKPLAPPRIGQRAFGGTVSRGAETHVGFGALDGELVIGATLAGFPANHGNIANLIALVRAQVSALHSR